MHDFVKRRSARVAALLGVPCGSATWREKVERMCLQTMAAIAPLARPLVGVRARS
jgi:hypothetical protein